MAAEEVVAAAEVVEDEEVTGKEVQVVLTAWAATDQESLTREDLVAEEAGITTVEWVVLGVINPSQLSASLQQSVELSSAEVYRLIYYNPSSVVLFPCSNLFYYLLLICV